MAHFLKDLPSVDERNFTRYQAESLCKSPNRRLTVHLPTSESPSPQTIVTDQTHILLRYLHHRAGKTAKKRSQSPEETGETSAQPAKVARTESQELDQES
ncbi:DET1- and DDB1-associated protein 1-like [Anomaloglossus baeobatrachus]|uniref:DET1- and DDB1-associated protein 1-like n=1 Tax=Anomaloglossus baeobatrachus TaxID=238106 RepID=UPI003F4F97F8